VSISFPCEPWKPFEEDLDDDIQSVALTSSFLTLISATLVKGGEGGGAVTAFVLLINLMVVAFSLWALVYDTIPSLIEEYQAKYDVAMAALAAMKAKLEKVDVGQKLGGVEQLKSPSGTEKANDASKESSNGLTINNAEVDEQISKLFARYDLDSSGTLNTKDELEQLCYNLAFKLKLENSTKDMDAFLNQVPELNDANAWDEATFALWFKKNILQQS